MQKDARIICNTNKSAYERGYDSNGDIISFMDVLEDQSNIGVEAGGDNIPLRVLGQKMEEARMVTSSLSAARQSQIIVKSKNKRTKSKKEKTNHKIRPQG